MALFLKASRYIYVAVNLLFGIFGAVIISISSFALANLTDFGALISDSGVKLCLSLGVFLVVLAVAGVSGVYAQNKALIGTYTTLMSVVMAAQVAGIVMIGRWSGALDDTHSQTVANLIACSYNRCCADVVAAANSTFVEATCVAGTLISGPRSVCLALGSKGIDVIGEMSCASLSSWDAALVQWVKDNVASVIGLGATAIVLQFVALAFGFYVQCYMRKYTYATATEESCCAGGVTGVAKALVDKVKAAAACICRKRKLPKFRSPFVYAEPASAV